MKKRKILILSHMHPRSNNPILGTFVLEQNVAMQNHGLDIKVISPIPFVPTILQNTPRRKAYRHFPYHDIIEGVPVSYPRYICLLHTFFFGISSSFFSLCVQRHVKTIIKKFQPDIIHSHSALPDGYAGLQISRNYRIPSLCTLHGDDINLYPTFDPFTMFLIKKVITGTDKLVAVSIKLKQATERLVCPGHPIEVIHNGIDLEKFQKIPAAYLEVREHLKLQKTDKIILFIGCLEWRKGVFEMIDAMSLLAPLYPDINLVIVGEGPERASLAKKIQDLNLVKQVHFIGQIPNSDVPTYLNACDMLLLPSYSEGFPTVIKEAMACEKPVIATNVGGIPEVVQDSKTGYIIPSKDVKAIVNAVIRCRENEELCKQMGLNSRKIVEARFSWDTHVKAYINVYEDLIERNGVS